MLESPAPVDETDQTNRSLVTETHTAIILNTQNEEILPQPEAIVEQESSSHDSIMCHMCLTHFQSRHDYYHHANLKHRETISKTWHHCKSCLWFFPARKSLHNHGCESESANLSQMKCQFCAQCFGSTSTADYIVHANTSHIKFLKKADWMNCSVCLKFYPNQESLDKHLEECQKDKDESAETEMENLGSVANEFLDEFRVDPSSER